MSDRDPGRILDLKDPGMSMKKAEDKETTRIAEQDFRLRVRDMIQRECATSSRTSIRPTAPTAVKIRKSGRPAAPNVSGHVER